MLRQAEHHLNQKTLSVSAQVGQSLLRKTWGKLKTRPQAVVPTCLINPKVFGFLVVVDALQTVVVDLYLAYLNDVLPR